MTEVRTFRDLRTWQEAQALVEEIYRLTASFPKEEVYGLTSQIRRCAVSISSNIAEGMGRSGVKELTRFLIMARGSLHELLSQLDVAQRLRYTSIVDFERLSNRYAGLNAGINAHLYQLSRHH